MPRATIPSETSYLYVIGHNTGPQKVGFSRRPSMRAKALRRTGLPRLVVHAEHQVLTEVVREIEAIAHWLLRHSAMGHEVFDVGPKEAAAAIAEAMTMHANGQRAPRSENLASERKQIVATKRWVRRIEEWAKRQPGRAPNFSEAVRILVDRAIDEEDRDRD